MQKKLNLKILSFLNLSLLISCKTKIEYVATDCLVIPAIQITQQDKESLLKYQDEFSYEFIKSLTDNKEIREKECKTVK